MPFEITPVTQKKYWKEMIQYYLIIVNNKNNQNNITV
jgi:hypothetical protein